ncbi:hypothetical protein ACLMJK_002590 [Lecanora helva]
MEDPWAPFLRIEALELDPVIKKFIKAHGSNPETFFNTSLDADLFSETQQPSGPTETILGCFLNVNKYQGLARVSRLRCLVMYLMFYDSFTSETPDIAPIHQKISSRFRQVSAWLGNGTIGGMAKHNILQRIAKYAEYGAVLQAMTERFSVGCLFFLVDYLTDDFLSSNPMELEQSDEALNHLEDLNLRSEFRMDGTE